MFRVLTIIFLCRAKVKKEHLDDEHWFPSRLWKLLQKSHSGSYLITAIFKVLSRQLRSTLTTAFERHLTVAAARYPPLKFYGHGSTLGKCYETKIDKGTWKLICCTKIWAYFSKNIEPTHFRWYCILLFLNLT